MDNEDARRLALIATAFVDLVRSDEPDTTKLVDNMRAIAVLADEGGYEQLHKLAIGSVAAYLKGDRELFAGFIGEMNREIGQLTGIKNFEG